MALVREGLTALISRLKDLLDEYSGNTQHHCNSTLTFFILFPGNALLEQLVKIARRILSFPVASPLMRVLVGLELLNAKLHDWEMNASREVSLAPHIEVRAQASPAKFFVCLTRSIAAQRQGDPPLEAIGTTKLALDSGFTFPEPRTESGEVLVPSVWPIDQLSEP